MHLLLNSLLIVAVSVGAGAGSANAMDDSTSAAERFKAIKDDVATADAEVIKITKQLSASSQPDVGSEQSRQSAIQRRHAGFAGALKIAQEDPQSEVAFQALEWLLLNTSAVYNQPEGKPALVMMARYHAANPKLASVISGIALHPPYGLPQPEASLATYSAAYKPAMDLFKAVADKNPDHCTRGQAAIGLALQAKRLFEVEQIMGNPDAQRLRFEADRAFELVLKNYAECACVRPAKGGTTLGARAQAELFEIRRLQPGEIAPEIAGDDLNGNKLKLGDYRGRVVLLVFWASWCGPCMAAVPHERELMDRFKGRPFVIVGVDVDEERAKGLDAVAGNQIDWDSFWDGPDSPYGPISSEWNVHFLPTTYIIDRKGVIRHVGLNGSELDAPLAKLVAEAEAANIRP